MSDCHRLVQMMREAGKQPQNEIVDIITGEVTSTNPLKVKVESRELTKSFLIVGALCQETRINSSAFTIPDHTHVIPANATQSSEIDEGAGSHAHVIPSVISQPSKSTPTSVLLWRGLKVGDRVLMLKVGKGQKYYILQREEGVV